VVTLIATLRAFWDTGNIRVRFVILAFLGWVFGSATFYTTLSMQGFQGIIPYFAASQVILSAVFVARFAKWTTTGQPRGEPIIGLAIFLTGRTRYLVWGIPLLEAIYCMLPFHLHPKWTIMVLTSVLGMIVFTSAHQSGWPWASRMRTICIYFLFFPITGLYIVAMVGSGSDHFGAVRKDFINAYYQIQGVFRGETWRKNHKKIGDAEADVRNLLDTSYLAEVEKWKAESTSLIAAGRPSEIKPIPRPSGNVTASGPTGWVYEIPGKLGPRRARVSRCEVNPSTFVCTSTGDPARDTWFQSVQTTRLLGGGEERLILQRWDPSGNGYWCFAEACHHKRFGVRNVLETTPGFWAGEKEDDTSPGVWVNFVVYKATP